MTGEEEEEEGQEVTGEKEVEGVGEVGVIVDLAGKKKWWLLWKHRDRRWWLEKRNWL